MNYGAPVRCSKGLSVVYSINSFEVIRWCRRWKSSASVSANHGDNLRHNASHVWRKHHFPLLDVYGSGILLVEISFMNISRRDI